MKNLRLHLFVLFGFAAILCTAIPAALTHAVTDWRFGRITRPATGTVVLVAIDPRSLDKIDVWPWPRTYHADLIKRLLEAGASDIAFDVDFSSASNGTGDDAFAKALAKDGGSVILPSFKQIGSGTDQGALHVNQPIARFRDQAWSALVNVETDLDSRVRSFQLGDTIDGQFVPSMAALLAGQVDAHRSPFLVDFGIDTASIPVVSFIDVKDGDPAALAAVKGKKVLIGGTAVELGDRFSVPRYGVISGPMLQLLATESLLQNRNLSSTSWVTSLGFVAAIVVLMTLVWRRMSVIGRTILLASMAAASELVGLLIQARQPLILDTSPILIILALYAIACALDEIDFRGMMRLVAERRFQRIALSLGDGLICVDHQRTITFFNPAAATIFGYTAAEIVGQPVDRLFNVESIKRHLRALHADPAARRAGRTIEVQAVRKSGESFPLEMCISLWNGADGVQYGAVLRDITARKQEEQRIRYLAEFDALTGLPNRNSTVARLQAWDVQQFPDAALLRLSIDNLGPIVDLRGSDFGDAVLRAFARRLMKLFGADGFVARLGDGDFAVIVPDMPRAAEDRLVGTWAARLEHVSPSRQAGPQRLKLSIGAVRVEEWHRSADEVLANAHLALYRARSLTGTRFMLYSDRIRDEIESRAALEVELKRAVANGEFELYYQPQHRLSDGRLVGAEALIRWRHPYRGLVSPGEFMAVVNASSMARSVADWVLTTAGAQARIWERAGHDVRVAVNLSPVQFAGSDLADEVATLIADLALSPHLLELEITEDILLDDMAPVIAIIEAIRSLGVRVMFDDFGTGFASLSYLRRLPADGLKLDQSFVAGMRTNSADSSIVASMISLGRQLGLSMIAEGIEDEGTAELLRRLGCDEGQGYYFGKPVPAAAFERLLVDRAASDVSNDKLAQSA